MKNWIAILAASLSLLACQADPAPKNIPFEPKEVVDKGFNDISFNPAVDILFIIDDSGSMTQFHLELARNAALFVERFFQTKFVDYHIGVTTCSRAGDQSVAEEGRLYSVEGHNFVERNTARGDVILQQMFQVGTSNNAIEEFFSIHQLALTEPNLSLFNKGFYRDHAQLAVFVVTDTDDQSRFDHISAYDFLVNLKNGDETKVHYAAALADQVAGCEGESGLPRKMEAMVEMFGNRGYKFDICKGDYGKDMGEVASNLVRAVSTLKLDKLPDVNTIEVSFGDIIIPNDPDKGWTYDPNRNAIILSPNIEILDSDSKELNIRFESIYR